MDKKELQEQLDQLKTELEKSFSEKAKKELQAEIKSMEDKIKAIEEKAADSKKLGEDVATATKTIGEVKTAVDEIKAANVKRDEADRKNQDAIDQLLTDVKGIRKNGDQGKKAKTIVDAMEEALNEGDNAKNIEMLAMNHKDRNKRFAVELKGINQKAVGDMTTSNVTGGSRYGQVLAPGIIESPKRKVHVRQLVPIGSAGPGNTFTFMAENGTGEGSIAPTAETGTKPQFDLDLVEKTVNFEIIAGWLRVTRKAMNNIPGFLSFLNSRLPELLLRAEDNQMISGDGVSPNLKGILTSGNNTAALSNTGPLIERIIDAISQLEDDKERNATGVLIRPSYYYEFFKNKATGSGEYDLPQNVTFANGQLYISGIPVFASTAIPDGKYIVGDWEMGAQLLIQEGMRIEFFEQDVDNVTKNKITVRIEESVAFPVYGSDFFIVGNAPAS